MKYIRKVLVGVFRYYWKWRAFFSYRLITGHPPRKIGKSEFFVMALMKNEAQSIDDFVAHYTNLGAAQIFLVDNGSTDASISVASRYRNVTVYRCGLDYKRHQCLIKRSFLERFLVGNWVVAVDLDELLRYPYDNEFSFSCVLEYMNFKEYTAATACMLDVFLPPGATGKDFSNAQLKYCDVESIEKVEYVNSPGWINNILPACGLSVYWGGVRKLLNPEGLYCLTKHPIMKISGNIRAFAHPHFCSNAKLADFESVLLHYKFSGDYQQKLSAAILSGSMSDTWIQENKKLSQTKNIFQDICDVATPKKFTTVERFADEGFLKSPINLYQYFNTHCDSKLKSRVIEKSVQ